MAPEDSRQEWRGQYTYEAVEGRMFHEFTVERLLDAARVAGKREGLEQGWVEGWFARDDAENPGVLTLTPPDVGMDNPYRVEGGSS